MYGGKGPVRSLNNFSNISELNNGLPVLADPFNYLRVCLQLVERNKKRGENFGCLVYRERKRKFLKNKFNFLLHFPSNLRLHCFLLLSLSIPKFQTQRNTNSRCGLFRREKCTNFRLIKVERKLIYSI